MKHLITQRCALNETSYLSTHRSNTTLKNQRNEDFSTTLTDKETRYYIFMKSNKKKDTQARFVQFTLKLTEQLKLGFILLQGCSKCVSRDHMRLVSRFTTSLT